MRVVWSGPDQKCNSRQQMGANPIPKTRHIEQKGIRPQIYRIPLLNPSISHLPLRPNCLLNQHTQRSLSSFDILEHIPIQSLLLATLNTQRADLRQARCRRLVLLPAVLIHNAGAFPLALLAVSHKSAPPAPAALLSARRRHAKTAHRTRRRRTIVGHGAIEAAP
jgi:hypothetical protein